MAGERTLPGLGLTAYWAEGSNGWKAGNDINMRLLSILVQGSAISATTALPANPVNGDIYIVPANAAQNANTIAARDNGEWVYIIPREGMLFYARDTKAYMSFNGAAWALLAASGGGGPIKDPDAHRWWGIKMVTANGNNTMAVGELTLHETVGGPSVVGGGVPGSTPYYQQPNLTYGPAKAFDSTNNTKFVGQGPTPGQMLWYAFAENVYKKIAQVSYRAAHDYPVETPTAFDIVWSDNGVDWTVAKSVTGFTNLGQSEVRSITL